MTRQLLLAAGLLAGCARMAPPPGGPPDRTPPVLIGTVPDSVRVLDGFDGWVEFRFDEVIAEGSQPNFGLGNGELERLVLLSPAPDSIVPRVQWKRNRLLVRPQGDWRPNTVYRIELAAGIRDIREPSNTSKQSSIITLATGGALPGRYLIGRAVDWTTQRAVSRALIEALLLPDSLEYRTLSDSTGRFIFGPLPQGEFLVRAVVDQNQDRRRNGREAWDTVRLASGRDLLGEIWAYPHDTIPPRIQSAERVDSFSIALTLSETLAPTFSLPADSVAVLGLPDSGSIGAVGALPQPAHDSLYRGRGGTTPVRVTGDSTPPTAPGQVPGRPAAAAGRLGAPGDAGQAPRDTLDQLRPPLTTRLMVRTNGVVRLGTSYLIEVRGVRSIGGGNAPLLKIRLDTPKPPAPPDSAKTRRDTTATARPDSLRRRPL